MTTSAENQPSDNEPSSLENPPTTNHNGSAGKNRRGIGRAMICLSIATGVFVGLGVYTFVYAKGASYLSNDPKSCVNCHVMNDAMDSWQHSSHHAVTVCNDCHMPHDFIGKWVTKADNGLFHSIAFTTGDYPDNLRIKDRNLRIVQQACLHCHERFVENMHPVVAGGDLQSCMHCHQEVGHALHP
ncbi:MAG: cytochrome c nitrite reductase small subunit [Rhodopirellula sp. TMED11]|nr:MAG: cytochrome c nitrite reductase small subunit [Rhodopirellula sp. TMED11]